MATPAVDTTLCRVKQHLGPSYTSADLLLGSLRSAYHVVTACWERDSGQSSAECMTTATCRACAPTPKQNLDAACQHDCIFATGFCLQLNCLHAPLLLSMWMLRCFCGLGPFYSETGYICLFKFACLHTLVVAQRATNKLTKMTAS